MLVYGDRSERAAPRERLELIARDCATIRTMPPGLDRHARLVGVLIEAGRLLQGIADVDFERAGLDRVTPESEALTAFLMSLGHAVCTSWNSRYSADFQIPDAPDVAGLPATVELREPEGFAFYAVYPEAYAEAALGLRLEAPPVVIGIRSIGTSLGAVVAAAIGARTFCTVRPFGDPFGRRVALSPQLEAELLADDAHYLIVDEGPGQSGSSFGAVADWLQERGVPLERIAFLPSHAGEPGAHASERHRDRWRRAQKVVADLGPRLDAILEGWLAAEIGVPDEPLRDISAGAWRRHAYGSVDDWPAAGAFWERRKYLARAGGESWLLKFAGLSAAGERKLDMARALHAAGWTPEPRALIHGFLVERWHGEASRLRPSDRPLTEIASYLGARARLFPAGASDGATIEELFAMMRRNCGLALGDRAADALLPFQTRLGALQSRVDRVRTDNRLDPHEWLRLPDGKLLKTDALDHHAAHDLIGAQDLAWDIAGAGVEFSLDARETSWLAAEAGRTAGRFVDPELLQFMTVAYLAFRLGQAMLSAESGHGDAAEQQRLLGLSDRYRAALDAKLLELSSTATRRDSSLGSERERTGSGTIPAHLG